MICWLDLFKTFASPAATLLGAGAAVYVTRSLGKAQVEIAESQARTALAQRHIAFDKLKHDLFEKRYEIYNAAKGIMERVIRTGTERPIDDHDLMNMRIKLDEGRFFFPPKPVALFEAIDQLTTQHEVARLSWVRDNDDDANRVRQGEVMGHTIAKLSELHRQFPKLMQGEMEFAQLTAPNGPEAFPD
ncbi:MAG: hypothetical protein ABSG03_39590 [Bryobacteraceae bacterium]|jgi:hypothetical protein